MKLTTVTKRERACSHLRQELCFWAFSFILGLGAGFTLVAAPPRLKDSDRHRSAVTEDGWPSFWPGEHRLEPSHRLNRKDAVAYLDDRAREGFPLIQVALPAEMDGLNTPNPYGHRHCATTARIGPEQDRLGVCSTLPRPALPSPETPGVAEPRRALIFSKLRFAGAGATSADRRPNTTNARKHGTTRAGETWPCAS